MYLQINYGLRDLSVSFLPGIRSLCCMIFMILKTAKTGLQILITEDRKKCAFNACPEVEKVTIYM